MTNNKYDFIRVEYFKSKKLCICQWMNVDSIEADVSARPRGEDSASIMNNNVVIQDNTSVIWIFVGAQSTSTVPTEK